uniref:Uncharacterized protein n=1 Tax=Rhizophora mucronata TaxID=61149 RepID=A0A2P2QNM2_RHIMU
MSFKFQWVKAVIHRETVEKESLCLPLQVPR